jgi:AcrR family transcriptional regulator
VSSSKVLRTKPPAQKSAVRKSYHHGDLEAALIESAINLVRETGPGHLSLRAVAEQVGVSPSAAYHYFPDKDSLIDAVGDLLFTDMAKMQQEALGKITGKSAKAAKERFRELGRVYFQWATKEPNLFRLMFGGFCTVDKGDKHIGKDAFIALSQALDDLLEVGVITPQMRQYGEILAWSTVQGASNLIVEGHLPREVFEHLLDALELSMMKGGK